MAASRSLASASVGRHLARGAIGFGLIASSLILSTRVSYTGDYAGCQPLSFFLTFFSF